jgi:hypothetical protein
MTVCHVTKKGELCPSAKQFALIKASYTTSILSKKKKPREIRMDKFKQKLKKTKAGILKS